MHYSFRVIYHNRATKEADSLLKFTKIKYDRLVKKPEENPQILQEPDIKLFNIALNPCITIIVRLLNCSLMLMNQLDIN